MAEDKAEQTEIKHTTGVPRDANWSDKVGLGGIVTGGGLAVYLAFVVMPEQVQATKEVTAAIVAMQKENSAHYRAMSDDRRAQFDQLSREMIESKMTLNELRREVYRRGGHDADALPNSGAPKGP